MNWRMMAGGMACTPSLKDCSLYQKGHLISKVPVPH